MEISRKIYPDGLRYDKESVEERRKWLNKITGVSLKHVGYYLEDSENVRGNIENFIGMLQMPIGITGPLKINGEYAKGDFFIPLATSEGALVLTYHRGMRVLANSGGVNVKVLRDETHISPLFSVKDLNDANEFIAWVGNNFNTIKKEAESTTHHGKLLRIDPLVMGKNVILRFIYFTQDAHGLNMINKATQIACEFIKRETKKEFFLRSNFSSIKKFSNLNIYLGQGKSVIAEAVIPKKVFRLLQVTPEELYKYYINAFIASSYAGAVGPNAHIANGITAMFIACGQDVADISNCHTGMLIYELLPTGDLYASLYIPNLLVGTVGGGTALGSQKECLELIGCYGSGKAKKLAEIIGAVALAGELATMASVINGTYVEAHEKYGRNKPK